MRRLAIRNRLCYNILVKSRFVFLPFGKSYSQSDETKEGYNTAEIYQECDTMLSFICYSKCTTCQRAKKWLDDNKIEYELRDIKTDNPTLEELASWYSKSGLPLKKFFNTSGMLYKSMELKTKIPAMTEEEMLSLLSTDGMLVKRPLLVCDAFVLVGFRESEWTEKLI